jgi:glycogen debranching enzyme
MLPAVLWMGDHEWVAKSLETVFRFQARAPIAIMSAEAGELPMEVCPGPIFLFGTSDTTLYYPGIVRRLWKVSGDRSRVEGFRPVLDRIAGWAERRCDPATGLLRNGGEIEGLKEAGASLGRVHFGIDASDTTIWDSVDRRDHAVDIQALGFEAFQALGDLAETLGLAESATAHRARADALGAAVRERYAWDSEAYLYDSLHSDGTPVAHVRPNALRTVSVGIAPGPLGRRLVERATRDDLSTAWGVRTLASSDADFDPTLYHDGEVWTIATAWAADAALKAGMTEVGLGFLKVNAQRLIDEFGLANECYRGDRAEPFNSCFLLGFSVAPFLTTIFDTLWGLSPQMDGGRIGCSPQFPPGWASARLTGLRLATGRLSLDYAPGRLRAEWDGASPLTLDGPAGSVTLEPGTVGELSLPSPR